MEADYHVPRWSTLTSRLVPCDYYVWQLSGAENTLSIKGERSRSKGTREFHLDKLILLIEDNPDDEALTLRAFEKSKISNKVVVAHDGAEALDYLFGTGSHAGRDTSIQPELILLDLRLPKVDGLEVLERLRADERTKLLPVVMLTSSKR